jgi:hypothetical protein
MAAVLMATDPPPPPSNNFPEAPPPKDPTALPATVHPLSRPTVSDFSHAEPVTVDAGAISQSAAYFSDLAGFARNMGEKLLEVDDAGRPVKAGNFAAADRLNTTAHDLIQGWAETCQHVRRILEGIETALLRTAARYSAGGGSAGLTASEFEHIAAQSIA